MRRASALPLAPKLLRDLTVLRHPPGDGVEQQYAHTDPHGILDASSRRRIEVWPEARHGDGQLRPAELLSIQVNREGLIVESVSWCGGAAALDHQIALAAS